MHRSALHWRAPGMPALETAIIHCFQGKGTWQPPCIARLHMHFLGFHLQYDDITSMFLCNEFFLTVQFTYYSLYYVIYQSVIFVGENVLVSYIF